MKKSLKLFLFAVIGALSISAQAQVIDKEKVTQEMIVKPKFKQIIGYFTSWEWYKRAGLAQPANFDFSKYTIINYSFFQTDKEGNLFGTDAWADSILLRGKYDYGNPVQPAYYPNTSMIDLAHVAGAKVIVSIGGWTLSETFPTVAADPAKRANFAHNCVLALQRYGFDGIDIDWEYPCYPDHKGTPEDFKNYPLFMKAIRDSIDAYGEKIKYKFLLTAAYGAPASLNVSIDYEKLVPFMDYFNMMTYDFNGTWSEDANHNSPLYAPAKGDTNAMSNLLYRLKNTYHVPVEKINMGVPFYGRSLLGKPGVKLDLHGKVHAGASDTITFVPDLGGTLYYNIMKYKDKFEEKWDEKSQVPYLVGKELNTFVSYDDPKSIKLKADFVRKNDLAGVIIWEISGDLIEKGEGSGVVASTPLIDALNESMLTARKKPIPKRWREPVTKPVREKGWRKNVIKQNFKNIYKPTKKAATPSPASN